MRSEVKELLEAAQGIIRYFAEQNPVCKKCHRTATPVLPCEQRLADAIIRVQHDDKIPDWFRNGT